MQPGDATQDEGGQIPVPSRTGRTVPVLVDADIPGAIEQPIQRGQRFGARQWCAGAGVYPSPECYVGARIGPLGVEGVGIGEPARVAISAALTSITIVPAGRSTPPTVTGTLTSRKSPRMGLS